MKTMPFIVDVRPVRSETLSSEEYLKIIKESPGLVARAQFIPPRQGAAGFGGFFVQYSRARHRTPAHG